VLLLLADLKFGHCSSGETQEHRQECLCYCFWPIWSSATTVREEPKSTGRNACATGADLAGGEPGRKKCEGLAIRIEEEAWEGGVKPFLRW